MALFKVRYKGLSDIREISKKHLADDRGVGVDGDLRWARPNDGPWGVHNVVYIENPSDELLQILKDEGTFTVSEVKEGDEPGEHEPIITGSVLDDTGSVVRDNTTGAVSVSNPAVPSGTEGGGNESTAPRGRARAR
jgi:hypothetical protein